MKRISVVLFVLALLCACAVGAYIFTSRLAVTFTAEIVPASENAELFAAADTDAAIEDCYFVTVRADITSYSPFKADWLTLNLTALEGDIVTSASDAGPGELEGMSRGSMYVTVLTQNPQRERQGRLEYYIFGRYHSIGIQYGEN